MMKTTQPARHARNVQPVPECQTGALAQAARNSPATQSLVALQGMADQSPVVQKAVALQRMEEDELQGKSIQRAESPKANNTGLPDNLKSGIESLSGMSMDHVKVHHNSDKPAAVQAHAYAQGSDIHLGPGQEKHLPHEAWHVVQQAQGRVKLTRQLKGIAVNDDAMLEKEADVLEIEPAINLDMDQPTGPSKLGINQQLPEVHTGSQPIQRAEINEEVKTNVYTKLEAAFSKNSFKKILGLDDKIPTFLELLSEKKLNKNQTTAFRSISTALGKQLDIGENTLRITEKSSNRSKIARTFAVVLFVEIERDLTPRGDLSDVIKFGTEFTFTSPEIITATRQSQKEGQISTLQSQAALSGWRTKLNSIPEDVTISEKKTRYDEPSYRCTYEDGWWFEINNDPGVIETQTAPMTLREAKVINDRVARDIFGIADSLGLAPDASYGGGHIHLDVETAFGDNELLFRDFIVDFENQGMAMEALEHDPLNAPRVLQGGEELISNFRNAVDLFDQENELRGAEAMKNLAEAIERRAYHVTPDEPEQGKYNALNYRHLLAEEGLGTLEIRALRAQRNYGEFLMLAKMFMRRIEFLEGKIADQKGPTVGFDAKGGITDNETSTADKTKVATAFRKYLDDLGIEQEAETYMVMVDEYYTEWWAAARRDKQPI